MNSLKRLVSFAIVLTMVVIVLGAYTRLTDAGLGCPDWPGCYGFMQLPQDHHADIAASRYPERPLEPHKARNEMVHRYFAGTLGLVIAAIFVLSTLAERKVRLLPATLLALVVFQAALGMWTVTLNLFPLVVMGHLLGGFSLLTLLWLYRRQLATAPPEPAVPSRLRLLGTCASLVLVLQIALGGWTSANYAAMACVELPLCHAGWTEQLKFDEAFDLHLGHDNYEFGVMSKEARQTIHISHRLGAVLTLLLVGAFAIRLWRFGVRNQTEGGNYRRQALLLLLLLSLQFVLGVLNIWWLLPLPNAVAHNFVAANLLAATIVARVQLSRSVQSARLRSAMQRPSSSGSLA
ncbi:MAG: COX15/CtaA family protein [Rheinheimera sp.]|nr:COX15/CtaA family protein [Rheinheimera sp.]